MTPERFKEIKTMAEESPTYDIGMLPELVPAYEEVEGMRKEAWEWINAALGPALVRRIEEVVGEEAYAEASAQLVSTFAVSFKTQKVIGIGAKKPTSASRNWKDCWLRPRSTYWKIQATMIRVIAWTVRVSPAWLRK